MVYMVLVDQRDEKIEVQQVSHRLGQVIFSEILHFIRSDDLSGLRYDQKPATSPLQTRGFHVCRLRHLLDTAQQFTDGRSQRLRSLVARRDYHLGKRCCRRSTSRPLLEKV